MMETQQLRIMDDVKDASRLLSFGLRDAAEPGEGDYRRLIQRYIADGAFQDLARAVADGLDLDIVSVDSRSGAILAPNSRQSLFAQNRSAYSQELSEEKGDGTGAARPVLALMHIAVALTFFPTAADLGDYARPQRPTATVRDVVTTMLGLAEQIKVRIAREGDGDAPETTPTVLRGAYAEILAYPRRREGPSRAGSASLEAIALRVMRHLEKRRLLRRYIGNTATDPFMATERYQHFLARGTAPAALEVCRSLLGRQSAPPAMES